jgi:hypothetical protein
MLLFQTMVIFKGLLHDRDQPPTQPVARDALTTKAVDINQISVGQPLSTRSIFISTRPRTRWLAVGPVRVEGLLIVFNTMQ